MNDNTPLGVVTTLSSEQHHADPAVGSSFLKVFQRSPLHAWAEYLDPDRERTDPKKFRIGRAWHAAVFEPDTFATRFAAGHDAHPATKRAQLLQEVLADELLLGKLVAVPDELKPTTKEGKAIYAEQEAAGMLPVARQDFDWIKLWQPRLSRRDVLPADTINDIWTMAKIAHALPISRVIFAQDVVVETSMFARHHATGLRLKIRPDLAVMPCKAFPHGLIVDGKTTTDASVEGFGRAVWNLDYGLQAAHYTRVFQLAMGTVERPAFLWMAQEKERPFAAKYYAAGKDLIAHYDAKIEDLMPRVAECHRTGVWPGYGDGVETLAMPAWAQKRIDEAAA